MCLSEAAHVPHIFPHGAYDWALMCNHCRQGRTFPPKTLFLLPRTRVLLCGLLVWPFAEWGGKASTLITLATRALNIFLVTYDVSLEGLTHTHMYEVMMSSILRLFECYE